MTRDPLRMYLVLRRGAIAGLARAGELAGAAAVDCVRAFAADPAFADAVAAWRLRPGKVCLRARTAGQWRQVLDEPHALAGDAEGEGAVALPPRPRSQRGPLLERLQAMSTALEPPPAAADPADDRDAVTYLLNPAAPMSSGKSIAQIAHAAVMAGDDRALGAWVAASCPARVLAPGPAGFAVGVRAGLRVACVQDAGLTEVAPGTMTVVALGASPARDLPAGLVASG
jgi:hypothetical protein